jgi:hypothetical protein
MKITGDAVAQGDRASLFSGGWGGAGSSPASVTISIKKEPYHCGKHGTRSNCNSNRNAITASSISPSRAASRRPRSAHFRTMPGFYVAFMLRGAAETDLHSLKLLGKNSQHTRHGAWAKTGLSNGILGAGCPVPSIPPLSFTLHLGSIKAAYRDVEDGNLPGQFT